MSDTKPSVPSTMKDMMKMFASPANNSGCIHVQANIAAVGIGASVKPAVPDVFLDNTEELSIEKIENLLYK